jgi:SAM-dependent methyltransferase
VLEVGCGTGTLAAALADRALAKVWAIDREPEMVALTRERLPQGAQAKVAEAEALPFKEGWFDRAIMRLVVHHLDRPRAFAELRRVLAADGRLVIATPSHESVGVWWLSVLLPAVAAYDSERMAPTPTLVAELEAAGFARVETHTVVQEERWLRGEAVRKLRGRYVSSLEVVSDEELEAAALRVEREFPEEIVRPFDWLVLVARA